MFFSYKINISSTSDSNTVNDNTYKIVFLTLPTSTKKDEGLMTEPDDLYSGDFPGSRRMKLPFKEAVERFIEKKYRTRVGTDLSKAEIHSDFPKLYAAINNYEKRWTLPFTLPSVRTLAKERFEKVVSVGLENAPRRDRDAANRITKTAAKKLRLG